MTFIDARSDRGPDMETQPSAWEAAYLRFETPEEEIRKFKRRLIGMGSARWPRDWQVVELFCGRGNGLRALHDLGFTRVEGIDLSLVLAGKYSGPGSVVVGDCRRLPFAGESRDLLIVQGGLHHLPTLPQDLDETLAESARVLRPGGRFVVVEPWLTPFLRGVHAVCRVPLARRLSRKIDAFATMEEHERTTYEQWLAQPDVVRASLQRRFVIELETVSWGKLRIVGRKR
jgi:ubiquinone/menaquinone biosynthesis C-methylase UbiE